jgi:hypothetical protein
MERGRVSLSGPVAEVQAQIEEVEAAYLSAPGPAAAPTDGPSS